MNCGDIERELRRVQAEHAGERLPMESILNALREDEYGDHLFARDHGDDVSAALLGDYQRHRTPRPRRPR